MAQSRQFITLDSIINDYINDSAQSNHKYFRLFHIAFRVMETLGIDFFYTIRSVKLPVLGNFTVQLPNDYLQYTKIGVLNSQGEIVPLAYNSKLTTYAELNPNRIQMTQDDTLFDYYAFNCPIYFNYWNGDAFMNLYGVPSGAPFVGSFKIDANAGVILLSEAFAYPYLMLEYVASPIEGQDYYVPMQFREAMIAGIAWKDIQNLPASSHFNLGDKRDRKDTFFNERRLAIARYKPLYIEDAYTANLESQRMTVKS